MNHLLNRVSNNYIDPDAERPIQCDVIDVVKSCLAIPGMAWTRPGSSGFPEVVAPHTVWTHVRKAEQGSSQSIEFLHSLLSR